MSKRKAKRIFLIGVIVAALGILIAVTPLGARIIIITRFQTAELLADDATDEYGLDPECFYVRNENTIRCLKQMFLRTECVKKSRHEVCSTAEAPEYYLGSHSFGIAMAYHYQLGPVRYHFVFKDSDYRIWRTYIDSTYNSGGLGYGMALN